MLSALKSFPTVLSPNRYVDKDTYGSKDWQGEGVEGGGGGGGGGKDMGHTPIVLTLVLWQQRKEFMARTF